jgi:DNA-binding transcriptional MerR regulator
MNDFGPAHRASTALVRPSRLDIDSFARVTGLHPDLVRRLVATGALVARQDASGTLWFGSSQVRVLGRIQRLRTAFGLNYAAMGLVIDLLDRIEALQAALRAGPRRWQTTGSRRWETTSGPEPPDPEVPGSAA